MTLELDFSVSRKAGTSLAAQIHDRIEWLIVSGHLQEATQLPPVRELAGQLGVNPHTVRAAYHKLQERGLVESRRGSGTTILGHDRWRRSKRDKGLRTHTVRVFIPAFIVFYGPYLRGLEEAADEEPSLLFVSDTHEHTRHVSRYLD